MRYIPGIYEILMSLVKCWAVAGVTPAMRSGTDSRSAIISGLGAIGDEPREGGVGWGNDTAAFELGMR
jgi:hypothetical protein